MIQVRMGNDGSYVAHDLSQQRLWNENEYQSFMDFLEADLSALREHLTDYFASAVDQETFDADDAYLDLEALRQAKYVLKDIHPFLYYDQGSAVLMDMLAGLLMAAMKKPKLLLLDEHTAALDPKTAAKVLEITDKLINENKLTALMVTHNMKDAIVHGNRLIMMNAGRIILDIRGEEKKNLTVEALLNAFSKASGAEFVNDRALLS